MICRALLLWGVFEIIYAHPSTPPTQITHAHAQTLEPAPPSLKALLYSLLALLSVAFQTHGGAHVQVCGEGGKINYRSIPPLK